MALLKMNRFITTQSNSPLMNVSYALYYIFPDFQTHDLV